MKVYKIATDGAAELVELPNGTVEEELDSLQAAVGGWIEIVRIAPDAALVVDEEGLLKGLEINPTATLFYGHPIAGPAVLCGLAPTPDGEVCTDVPERFIETVNEMMEVRATVLAFAAREKEGEQK